MSMFWTCVQYRNATSNTVGALCYAVTEVAVVCLPSGGSPIKLHAAEKKNIIAIDKFQPAGAFAFIESTYITPLARVLCT